jgi:hypothetical protein
MSDTNNKPYKLVVVVPAGRRRYMEVLLPYILKQRNFIDEYRLWINTNNKEDIEYIKGLSKKYSGFITTEDLPKEEKRVGDNLAIHNFFRNTVDPNTVYIRVDDDVVWVEENYFKKLYEFRIKNPDYWLVHGNVVNNAVCDHLHQKNGIYPPEPVYKFDCIDKNGLMNPQLAEQKHLTFLDNLKKKNLSKYILPKSVVLEKYERVSINSISWFGSAFAKFGGKVGVDEEKWLSVDNPKQTGIKNIICNDALCVHFAFGPQRGYVDSTGVLESYKQLSLSQWGLHLPVAKNTNTSVEVLNKLSDSLCDEVRIAVASNSNISVEDLHKLSNDKHSEVRAAVASNVKTPIDILVKLSTDDVFEVKHAVASNNNTPSDTLTEMVKDGL